MGILNGDSLLKSTFYVTENLAHGILGDIVLILNVSILKE